MIIVESSRASGIRKRSRKIYKKLTAMRTKNLLLILCCVALTTIIFILLGPAGQPNDSFKSIVSQTHQQINILQENLRVSPRKKFEIEPKYLSILGFTNTIETKDKLYYKTETQHNGDNNKASSTSRENENVYEIQHLPLQSSTANRQTASTPPRISNMPYNGTKTNFSVVTYVQDGQAPSAILLAQNIAAKFPNEYLLIYDLGLSEEESRALNAYCNNSKCSVIVYDLSVFPSHVADKRMHAFRPIVIKDALMRAKVILFTENNMRTNGTSRDLAELQSKVLVSGVLGWNTPTAVSTRTHPRMFDYFQTDANDFFFLRMVDLDVVLLADNLYVTEKIMLPWIKCALTLECIDPIGAQSNGCKFNKKPQYRYSGCHSYDTSAFNIVLGLTWRLDDSKYSLPSDSYNIFYKETLEEATKILENRRRNNSLETSEHPFTDD